MMRTGSNFFKRLFKQYKQLSIDRRYSIWPQTMELDQRSTFLVDLLIQYDLRLMQVDATEVRVELGAFLQSAVVLKNILTNLGDWSGSKQVGI